MRAVGRLVRVPALLLPVCLAACTPAPSAESPEMNRIPLAVIGDSDSHGFQDTRSFPPGSPDRGGPNRATTYQWTEALAALRGNEIDLGPRTETGTWGRLARVLDTVGIHVRAPRKLDHLHNFAFSGQGCADLWNGPSRQVPRLLELMGHDPQRWRRGVVVIRIGVNTFGSAPQLDRLARDPADVEVAGLIDTCLQRIGEAVAAIGQQHPQTRVVVVGIFDNRHWAKYLDRWKSAREQANISSGLDRFDKGLRTLASANRQVAFFDDRAWFAGMWGGRDASGAPAYRSVPFGPLNVTNTAGDAPVNACVADGHAGTAWNTLWARALVDLLNQRFAMGIAPLTDAEMASLLTRPAGS